jgi:hypothetical protein
MNYSNESHRHSIPTLAGLIDARPDILLEISDASKVRFTRLSTGNEVQPEDAWREDILIPAMHAQAVVQALTEYLRRPLALS